MAKLQAHGAELHRYFSVKRAALISIRADGVTLYRTIASGWKVLMRKRADYPLDRWTEQKAAMVAGLPDWQRAIKGLPSFEYLMRQDCDGICDTPTGHRVEPDGTGPDGVPSWLRLLRLI
jgi:hypothetical protein